jgi:hypothetical protein
MNVGVDLIEVDDGLLQQGGDLVDDPVGVVAEEGDDLGDEARGAPLVLQHLQLLELLVHQTLGEHGGEESGELVAESGGRHGRAQSESESAARVGVAWEVGRREEKSLAEADSERQGPKRGIYLYAEEEEEEEATARRRRWWSGFTPLLLLIPKLFFSFFSYIIPSRFPFSFLFFFRMVDSTACGTRVRLRRLEQALPLCLM